MANDYTQALAPYNTYIANAANKYDVPASIIRGVIAHESGGNQYAVGKIGEQGLMQLTPKYYTDVANKFDPEQNIDAGTKSLAQYYKKYGNWADALGYYNAGEKYQGTAAKAYVQQVMTKGGMSVLPGTGDASTTQGYIDKAFKGRAGMQTAAATDTLDTGYSPREIFMGWLAGDVKTDQAFKLLTRRMGLWFLAFLLIGFGLWRMING